MAVRLGVSPKAVRALILRGELRAYKVANRIRVADSELEAFLEALRVAPAPKRPPVVLPLPDGRPGSLRAVFREQNPLPLSEPSRP